jgi:heme exporter protein B
MRQRVAVARALIRRPELLLLDEPYAGLDETSKDVVDRAIEASRAEGRTVMLATHDPARGPRRRSRGGSSVNLWKQTMAIAGKDLRIEARGRYATGAVLPFAATLLIAFGLSLGPGRTLLQQAAPGLLWLAVLFASVLAFRQAYHSETEDGALEGLVLSPVDRAAVFLGKVVSVTAELVLLEIVVVLLVAALFDLSLGHAPGVLAGAFVLGTIGLAAVGSLFGVMAESPRSREAIFPLLIFPMAIPVLVAGVKATELATVSRAGGAGQWLGLLVAFDVVVLGVGTLVYGQLLED